MSDFLYLAIGLLDFLSITHFDGAFFSSDGVDDFLTFADVGNGVVQGVFEQMQTIVFAKLSLHGIFVQDIAVLVVATDGILVHIGMIAYP